MPGRTTRSESSIAAKLREVVAGKLWIGNARDARDISAVMDAEIHAVIDLAIEEPAIQFPRDIVDCRFPLMDGDGNSAELIQSAILVTVNFFLQGHLFSWPAVQG